MRGTAWHYLGEHTWFTLCERYRAWVLFCDELGVCGDHVVDGAPGDWIVDLADINMPTIAPNDEEMAGQMRDLVDQEIDASDVVTAEKAMEEWQTLYRGLLGQ